MLASMCLSIVFIIVDTLSATSVIHDSLPFGIQPFWKVTISPYSIIGIFFVLPNLLMLKAFTYSYLSSSSVFVMP